VVVTSINCMSSEVVVCMLICVSCRVSLYFSVCCCTSAGDSNWNVRPSNRIQIRNLPAGVTKDEIEQLVGAYGTVKKSQLGMHLDFMFDIFWNVKTVHEWICCMV